MTLIDLYRATLTKALYYQEKGDHEKALTLYGRLKDCPDLYCRIASINNAGAIFIKRKQYHIGLAIFGEALTIYPNTANLWLGYALCLDNIGKFQEAFDAYSTALSIGLKESYVEHANSRLKMLGLEIGKIREIFKK